MDFMKLTYIEFKTMQIYKGYVFMFAAADEQAQRLWRLGYDHPGGAVLRFSVCFSLNAGSEKLPTAVCKTGLL